MLEETAIYQVGKDKEINIPKFPESKIRAIAERLWWHKASKKTLAKYNYLTEKEVNELQATCQYREYVEKIMFERFSAEDFKKWVLPQDFYERMGLKPEVVENIVEQVHQRHVDKEPKS